MISRLFYVLGYDPDQLSPEERCAATSNRNSEGRQGRGEESPYEPSYGCCRHYRSFNRCSKSYLKRDNYMEKFTELRSVVPTSFNKY